jgi:hypothetical protein
MGISRDKRKSLRDKPTWLEERKKKGFTLLVGGQSQSNTEPNLKSSADIPDIVF